MSVLEDGAGSGLKSKVDAKNRLTVHAVIETEEFDNMDAGVAYNINPGTITLTSGNSSALLYFKNTSTVDVGIPSFVYMLGNPIGANTSTNILAEVVADATTGTLISGGTDFVPTNRRVGSGNVLISEVKYGSEGSTLTNGTTIVQSLFNSVGRQVVAVPVIVPPQHSVSIRITPQENVTNMDVQVAIVAFEHNDN